MRAFLLNIILALAWAALFGDFSTIDLLVGFVLGFIALWMIQGALWETSYFGKAPRVVTLVLTFFWALIVANVRVAYSVLAPQSQMRPGIAAIPLDIESDIEITLLANMITLTPGTLSIDVSDDRRTLYVHGMHIQDLEEFRREIKDGFERRVREAFE